MCLRTCVKIKIMADSVRIITTSRRSTKIGYKGYLYIKKKTLANDLISYECEHGPEKGNQEFKCKTRVKYTENLQSFLRLQ